MVHDPILKNSETHGGGLFDGRGIQRQIDTKSIAASVAQVGRGHADEHPDEIGLLFQEIHICTDGTLVT